MQDSKQQLIYGRHPVQEALEAGNPIEKVWLQQGTRGELEKVMRHLCREHGVPLVMIPRERLQSMVKGNHQGVVAMLGAVRYHQLSDVLPGVYEQGATPLLLLLDGVTDVRNIGAIARSAEVCGAQTLVTPMKGSGAINPEAVKTSAGALSRLPICRETSIAAAITYLQASGVQVLASDLKASHYLHELDLCQPVAFVLGAEGDGINPAIARAADIQFKIPQAGSLNSFNVSVAAGIMLYEAMRQRQQTSLPPARAKQDQ